jgi:hypothetical protein
MTESNTSSKAKASNWVSDVIAMVNDASRHYKPDLGPWLRSVAKKMSELGIPTGTIEWHWRDQAESPRGITVP